jgi:Cu(I)/Ag(I) efflux system protein CusF
MKKRNHLLAWMAACLLACGTVAAQAQSHAGHGAPAAAAPMGAQESMTAGEIRKVDTAQGKLTIRHEEIKSLMMPPMTMVFTVKDPSRLQGLKVGDKVLFEVIDQSGRMLITRIQKAS